jgi:hypothetical protein
VEGSEVLERLEQVGLRQEFLDAVDSDDHTEIKRILEEAGLLESDIIELIEEIKEGN